MITYYRKYKTNTHCYFDVDTITHVIDNGVLTLNLYKDGNISKTLSFKLPEEILNESYVSQLLNPFTDGNSGLDLSVISEYEVIHNCNVKYTSKDGELFNIYATEIQYEEHPFDLCVMCIDTNKNMFGFWFDKYRMSEDSFDELLYDVTHNKLTTLDLTKYSQYENSVVKI